MMILRRAGHAHRGQSLVEFALILPIFLILLLGLLDFGRGVAAYNSVSNAARSAARVAIVNQDQDAIRQAAEAEGFSGVTVESGFVEGQENCPGRIGCIIEVEVSYTYVPATPIFSQLVGDITVSSTSQMPVEFPNP